MVADPAQGWAVLDEAPGNGGAALRPRDSSTKFGDRLRALADGSVGWRELPHKKIPTTGRNARPDRRDVSAIKAAARSSKVLKNALSRRLLKKARMQGGVTHPCGWVPGAE